jgi:hypothetical protein
MPANPFSRMVQHHTNRCKINVEKQKVYSVESRQQYVSKARKRHKYASKRHPRSLKKDGRSSAWVAIVALMSFFADAAPHGCHPAKHETLRRCAI